MTYDQLLAKARRLEGSILETKRGKPFRVGVFKDCPFFTPTATGLGRSDGRKAAEQFLERWNQTKNPMISSYSDVTRNASYLLVLVNHKE